ncbi:acyl-CoA dehydrogenase [Xylaria bambusicola]|uniref:acyl-CoA dehydrogenase n=1 Tax=Xylaria bambusicola TaxID=326684 RepID=UPI0020086383|nr:acyl-CoA dehydrogenase [Xylaria bambusicola]KAI0512999.1 acyl-CoA dehydrogenase [Xylaria bambusicola]
MDQEFPWTEPPWLSSLASPYYDESHRRLQAYARKYYDENVIPHMLEWEEKGDCPEPAKQSYLQSGLGHLEVPREYRPREFAAVAGIPIGELDIFHRMILIDESSRVEGGVTTALSGGANVIGVPPIVNYGTEVQKKRWLPGIFTGETNFCLGITEPSGGSDVSNLKNTAKKNPDGTHYIVSGTKKWITGSQWATHMTTAVRTGGPGARGISLIVIPLSLPGVSVEKIRNSGQSAGGASWVRMDNVRVPADHLLGVENAGFMYVMKNFNNERFVMAIGCNRKARTCLSTALAYAHERETFGIPLIGHQVIRHKLVHLAREIEAHWARLEQIAYHIKQHGWESKGIAGPIAMAKISGGRILELAAREAQQVMGGIAYQRDGPGGGGRVEQITRDLRMMVVGGGSEEILGDLAFKEEIKTAKKKADEKSKL